MAATGHRPHPCNPGTAIFTELRLDRYSGKLNDLSVSRGPTARPDPCRSVLWVCKVQEGCQLVHGTN